MKTRVTQKDIAAALGLSTQAVSMALRGHRKIAPATRARVREKADRMGYVPDPALRALAEYRSHTRTMTTRWDRVALLHNWPSEQLWRADPFYKLWKAHLIAALAERGMTMEEHGLGAKGEKAKTVFRTLHNRGITGIFVAPPAITADPPALELPRDRFEIVTFGPEYLFPDFHTVQFDFYGNLRLAWRKLWERGRRRIGLVYLRQQEWRTGSAWQAAYHIEKRRAGLSDAELVPLVMDEAVADLYVDWVSREKPDAVITSIYALREWSCPLAHPPEVAFFNVREPQELGVDLNLEQMARTAVELMLLEMRQSLVQRRDLPFRVHIPGKWVEA